MRARTITGLLAIVLVITGSICDVASGQPPSDWIGTYEGAWKSGNLTGDYGLVIERVDGNIISGSRITTHPTMRSPSFGTFPMTGTIDGNTINYKSGAGQPSLTRIGDQLSGHAVGIAITTIEIKKVK
jgi:hypothetical protein